VKRGTNKLCIAHLLISTVVQKELQNYEDLTPIFVVLIVNEQKLKMMAQEDTKTSPVYFRNDEEEPEQSTDSEEEVDSLPGRDDVLAHGAQPSIHFDKKGPRIYVPNPSDILLGRGKPYVTCLLVVRV
jgi:hypothetical protein